MLIMICCITILITYIVIFGLLTYYFIKKRTVWNELFSIDSITDTLVEIFACPEHFIIYIPGVLFENTPCVQNKTKKNENKEKIKLVLTKTNTIFKKFITVGLENFECKPQDNSLINNNINQVKWILDGTLDNFNNMYDETAEFYNNISGSYKILNENTNNNSNNSNNNSNNNTNLITLEKLVLLEQNIEYCDSILKLLEIIEFETLFQIENNYILCLIYNLIESIKMYKIVMYKIVNL